MKKYSFLLIIHFWPIFLIAQSAGEWTAGVVFQPFFYQCYNKADWHWPESYPITNDGFNGLAAGLSVTYGISDRFSLGAELTYARQKQRYQISALSVSDFEDRKPEFFYPGAYKRLDYLKLPLLAIYRLEIGEGSGLFIRLMTGMQLAYNTTYRSEFIYYGIKRPPERGIDFTHIGYSELLMPFNGHYESYASDGTQTNNKDYKTEYLYQRLEAGAFAGAGFQKQVFSSWLLSLGIHYELGLTGIENPDENKYLKVTHQGLTGPHGLDLTVPSMSGETSEPRPSTYNRRWMLDVGISYVFD